MPKLLKLSFLLILFLCLSACNESPVVEFYSYHELMEYEFFSRGWFPEILKEDASGIKESYDVSSRYAFGQFEFKQRELYEADLKTCPTVAAGLLQEMMDKIERPSLPQWFVPKDSLAKGHLLIKH